jgi:hypothetical protein
MSLSYQQRTPALARSLRDVARACPDRRTVQDAFGGTAGFFEATVAVSSLRSLPRGPISTARHLPHMAHETFLRDCVKGWRMAGGGRPGLPQLARALLRDKGIDIDNLPSNNQLAPQERAIVRAIMLTALRAETNANGARNAYHNPVHTAHVATMAGYLTDLNDHLVEGYGRFVEFAPRDKLLVILAAFAHDIDHPGRPNPPDDRYANEKISLAAVMPIMRGAGMSERDIARVETMILTTSPNGPHAYLKDVAQAHAHRYGYKHIADKGYNELAHLGADRELVQMAAILSDADLFASAGTGIEGSRLMARRLTNECRRAGMNIDFTTAASCKGFLTHVVGMNGFASQAAMAGFNRQFRSLVAANDAALKKCGPQP